MASLKTISEDGGFEIKNLIRGNDKLPVPKLRAVIDRDLFHRAPGRIAVRRRRGIRVSRWRAHVRRPSRAIWTALPCRRRSGLKPTSNLPPRSSTGRLIIEGCASISASALRSFRPSLSLSGSFLNVVPARLSSVSQPSSSDHCLSLSLAMPGELVVVEVVSHAVIVEPGARLLHGVAVLDAVDGDGFVIPSAKLIRVSFTPRPARGLRPARSDAPSPRASLSLSSSPSERLMTMQATPLPMRLVSARHSLMNLSMPTRMAIDWIGISGTIESVAASVMKPAPVTPEAPFEVMMATPRMPSSCQIVRCRVGRLRREQRRQRHVDVGAVEIEAVAGRDDKADHRARRAEMLHLLHHLRQNGFRGRGSEHDQQFVLDVEDEANDREARDPRDRPENDQYEQHAGQIEGRDQRDQIPQRGEAVGADGERHRAEGPDRREAHDHADDAEEHLRRPGRRHGRSARRPCPEMRWQSPDKDRHQQDLQQVAAGERAEIAVGNDPEQMRDDALFLCLGDVGRDRIPDRSWPGRC